jgi:hypothetical protein
MPSLVSDDSPVIVDQQSNDVVRHHPRPLLTSEAIAQVRRDDAR